MTLDVEAARRHTSSPNHQSPNHRITKSLLALGRYVRPQGEAPCTSKTFVCRRGYLRQSPITIYSTSGICILSILTNLTFPITLQGRETGLSLSRSPSALTIDRSPITNHQSPPTNHQSPVTLHYGALLALQPTNHQSLSIM